MAPHQPIAKPFNSPGNKFRPQKIFILLILLVTFSCKKEEIITNDLEGHFEKFWSDFDQTYSYFELKGIDWDSVYSVNRPKIINGKTMPSELAKILGEITLSLNDMHLMFEGGGKTYRYQNRDQFVSNSPANAINYLSSISLETNELLFGEIKNLNIAYLRVKTLNSNGNFQPLESIPSDIANKDAFILDLRDNGGGSDGVARNFVNRLIEKEKVHELVRFRNGPGRNDFGEWLEAKITPDDPIVFEKPIVVLINRGVVSSAESFVTMLMTLPNTTLVGDTTHGSTGNPKNFQLSNGWKYWISSWQAVTPDFTYIEDRGIAPDIVIYNTDESMSQGKDLMLEKAIEIVE